jgi:hypothetical protein
VNAPDAAFKGGLEIHGFGESEGKSRELDGEIVYHMIEVRRSKGESSRSRKRGRGSNIVGSALRRTYSREFWLAARKSGEKDMKET